MFSTSKEEDSETRKRLRYICLRKGITAYSVINELVKGYIDKNLNSYDISFLKDKNIKDIIKEYKNIGNNKNPDTIKPKKGIDIRTKSSFPVYESPELLYDNVIDLKAKSIPVFLITEYEVTDV